MFQSPLDRGQGGGLRSPALLASLRKLAAAALENAHARFELLAYELAEEKSRLVIIVALAGALVGTTLLTLGFAGLGVVIWAWQTEYRLAVAIGLPIVLLLATVGIGFALRHFTSQKSALFRHSLEELRQDVASLRETP